MLALLMTCGGLSGALAQDAAASDSQQPPAEQQAPSDQQSEKPKCVTSNTAY